MLLHCLHALNAQSHITCDCSDASCIIACLMHSVTISLLAIVGLHPTLLCRLTGFPFTNMPRLRLRLSHFNSVGCIHNRNSTLATTASETTPRRALLGKQKKIQRRSIFALAIISVKQFSQLLMTFVKGFAKTSPEIIQQPCAWECYNSWDILCWPRVSWIGRKNTRGCIEGVTCYKQASAWEALHWFLVRKANIGAEMRDRCKCDSE